MMLARVGPVQVHAVGGGKIKLLIPNDATDAPKRLTQLQALELAAVILRSVDSGFRKDNKAPSVPMGACNEIADRIAALLPNGGV